MSSSKAVRHVDIAPDMLDQIINRITALNSELMSKNQVISKLKGDNEGYLSLFKELNKDLETLLDDIATKNQELEKSEKERRYLRERVSSMEVEIKEMKTQLSNFTEMASVLEAKLIEVEEVVGDDGSKAEMDTLEMSSEESEIIGDIRKKIETLRGL